MRLFIGLFLLTTILAAALPTLAGPRQGGDTIADATIIPAIPFQDVGTTEGYVDDYDAPCPYYGTDSPDVVYVYTALHAQVVTIDLCGSSYDTRVWVLDPALEIIACNDDYYPQGDPCGSFVSYLDEVGLTGGVTYHIVVDGYGGAAGEYTITVTGEPVAAATRSWSAVRSLYR